jgi:hypothetical protein
MDQWGLALIICGPVSCRRQLIGYTYVAVSNCTRIPVAGERWVLEVVFSILNVIATDDLEVSVVLILFVVEEVDAFEKSLFMVL